MTPEPDDILRELLVSEQRSLASRFVESTLFVAAQGIDEQQLVSRIARDTNGHCAKLTEVILRLGGSPGPRAGDVNTAHLHFLDVHKLISALAADRELLVRKYSAAAARLAREPIALAAVNAILEQHRRELEQLRALETASRRAG